MSGIQGPGNSGKAYGMGGPREPNSEQMKANLAKTKAKSMEESMKVSQNFSSDAGVNAETGELGISEEKVVQAQSKMNGAPSTLNREAGKAGESRINDIKANLNRLGEESTPTAYAQTLAAGLVTLMNIEGGSVGDLGGRNLILDLSIKEDETQ